MAEEKKTESASAKASADKEEKKEVEVPEKFKKLVEGIENLKTADLAELVKILEGKFGVVAAPQVVAVAPIAGAEAAAAGVSEKQQYNIELTAVGEKKIEVIKVIRDVIGKGLKEAKDIADSVTSGSQVIKEGAKKEEAEEIKKKFEAAGATVELK